MRILDSQIDVMYKAENEAVKTLDLESAHEKRYSVKKIGVEAYERSKWVEFDSSNPATKPGHGDNVLCVITGCSLGDYLGVCTYDFGTNLFFLADDVTRLVTHWQALPEFNEDGRG